jgi:hypothetical protein
MNLPGRIRRDSYGTGGKYEDFERWCEMSADEQNTPRVIAEMRKLEGIDGTNDRPYRVGKRTGTTVKSPDSYLFLDQMKEGGYLL